MITFSDDGDGFDLMGEVEGLFHGLVHRSERSEVDHHRGIGVFRNRFCGGGVDRDQCLVSAPVQLGVVVAVEGENLQSNKVEFE